MNKTTKAALAATASMLALPAAASARVDLHPNVLPAGDFPTVSIRVPNETDNARTVRVDVKIPPGFTAFEPQAVPGWTVKLVQTKLATADQDRRRPGDRGGVRGELHRG